MDNQKKSSKRRRRYIWKGVRKVAKTLAKGYRYLKLIKEIFELSDFLNSLF